MTEKDKFKTYIGFDVLVFLDLAVFLAFVSDFGAPVKTGKVL